MTTVVIVFIVLMIVVTAFAAAVIIDELVQQRKESTATVPQTTQTWPIVATDEATDDVATNATEVVAVASAPTHEEKVDALPEEVRSWYDEIVGYAAAIDGAKHTMRKRYEEYTHENSLIVRLTISKDVIVCAFMLRNSAFFTYASENEIAVSTAPTKMKITSKALVDAAKRTIDMVVANIEEENALTRRLADERRERDNAQSIQNNDEQGVTE